MFNYFWSRVATQTEHQHELKTCGIDSNIINNVATSNFQTDEHYNTVLYFFVHCIHYTSSIILTPVYVSVII